MHHSLANVNFIAPPNPQLPTGGFISIHAYAKINLFLNVINKREDGYHNLVSVMQSLNLHDCLEFYKTTKPGVTLEATNVSPNFPLNESNLIVKAANLLINKYQINEGINIKLNKQIPMGAGLGGGSSNCAATLHGLNKLFNLNISLETIMEIGKTLGADVPFCLLGGTALAKGIGEKLTSIAPHPKIYVVLACPGIHVSTKEVFNKLNLTKSQHTNYSNMVSAIETGNTSNIAENFYNIFTEITAKIHPIITQLIDQLKQFGAINASMTGTGSVVFGYFENETDAQAACNSLNVKTFLTTTCSQ